MKGLIIALILVVAASVGVSAQTRSVQERAKAEVAGMSKAVNLEVTQSNRLQVLLEEHYNALAAIEPLKTSSPQDYARKLEDLTRKYNAVLANILTPEQAARLKQ